MVPFTIGAGDQVAAAIVLELALLQHDVVRDTSSLRVGFIPSTTRHKLVFQSPDCIVAPLREPLPFKAPKFAEPPARIVPSAFLQGIARHSSGHAELLSQVNPTAIVITEATPCQELSSKASGSLLNLRLTPKVVVRVNQIEVFFSRYRRLSSTEVVAIACGPILVRISGGILNQARHVSVQTRQASI